VEPSSRLTADVVVLGGGIIGCSAAAIMADRGARVVLVEGSAIGAGASGRNLGVIQHPFDSVLAPLHRESLTRYQALAEISPDFAIGAAPAGLLLLNRDGEASARQRERLADAFPELDPVLMSPEEVHRTEPALTEDLYAVAVATGYPVPPAAATDAWADLAEDRGARLLVGTPGRVDVAEGRAVGAILEDGTRISAGAVLVAAGPWTPRLVDESGTWRPIVPTYGVTLQVKLDGVAPTHVLEEDVVDAVNRAAAATELAAEAAAADEPASLFSLATARGASTLGSTFLASEPDAAAIEPLLLQRATEFLPAMASAEVVGRRMCARPQSVDGRPFIGPVPGVADLFVCAGHGPWGISTGPASAALAARAVLDGAAPPAELAATR
jgi:glycine/D-amino acid oxidase-like deaminating enzyme